MKNLNKKKILVILLIIQLFLILLLTINVLVIVLKDENKTQSVNNISKTEDFEKPEIKLNGKEEIIVVKDNEYVEENATAIDNIDGDITDKIKIEGYVDTSNVGEYTIKYLVQDEAGNAAAVIRNVKVCEKLSEEGLPVLMYHFFYDKNKGRGKDYNWIEISKFEEQIKYLKDNNYYFPTWKEVEDYIDRKQDLPEKSIVITVDDGDASFFELAVPVLNKYNIDATSFVITEWYGYRVNEPRKNVIYESHSNNMHEPGANGKGKMLSASYSDLIKDLKISKEILNGAEIFCYPFGHYDETCIKALKETGYKLAFTTEEGKVTPGASKYKLPRVRISSNIGMKYFIEQVSNQEEIN